MSETFPVKLAVYDLSRGMARSLSAQFLGVPLDMIPHTAIIVYGMEYFFGAGIQSEAPAAFRRSVQMFPLQELDLGRTCVSQADFEAWCVAQMHSGRFSAAAYDLFQCNCNHFSHDAALIGLRLTRGVPHDILDVPQRVLASPMGQMIRPMLQNMQVTRAEGSEQVHAPFSNSAARSVDLQRKERAAASISNTNSNPWATTAPLNRQQSATSSSPAAVRDNRITSSVDAETLTTCLDSFTAPLLSKETSMLPLCANKLSALASNEETKSDLQESVKLLSESNLRIGALPSALVESIGGVISHSLAEQKSVSFALLLLRILVLRRNQDASWHSAVKPCLARVITEVRMGASLSGGILKPPSALAAAWLTCANAIGVHGLSCCKDSNLQLLFDAAAYHACTQTALPARQAVCAFVYNAALVVAVGGGIGELQVPLVCSSMSFADEKDATCRLCKLMTIGRMLKPSVDIDTDVKSLLAKMGALESLSQVALEDNGDSMDDTKCRTLAGELMQLLAN
ncbi:hypothetical protein MPSEU_000618200 [Mayamaea pseudoterrestris]|nr:hypothetical protein MPSEU_000618200 [Mayamaea pseudoterrestris]